MKKIGFIKDEFQPWAMHALKLGFTDFISPEDGFLIELSKNSKWTNSHACGIYAWVTGNGQSYVGQAVNVRNRLRQHWTNHRNIAYAAFQAVSPNDLDSIEKQLIRKMEEHFPSSTLNIKFATSSMKVVPFDLIITPEICANFLRGESLQNSNEWQNWPLLENKKVRNFERFEKARISKDVMNALSIFIDRCLPDAPATEVKFWSASYYIQMLQYAELTSDNRKYLQFGMTEPICTHVCSPAANSATTSIFRYMRQRAMRISSALSICNRG